MAHDVFISYSHHDKLVADAVCATLEGQGIRCWIAPRDVIAGQEWGAAIVDAIRSVRVMVLIFSSHANASPQIIREVERAVHASTVLVPFRIEDVTPEKSLEFFLGTPHWLDAMTPPLEAHLQNLAAAVQSFLTVSPLAAGATTAAPPTNITETDQPVTARQPNAVHALDQPTVTIGRAPENNVVLTDLLVSRRHARLRRDRDRWELGDLGSANGTYVNGARISCAVIGPDDIVGIGHQRLNLSGDRLIEYLDTGDVILAASNLKAVTNKGRVLLADISFVLPQRSLLAVVGPRPTSAEKSTILDALRGLRHIGSGSVRYNNRDVYADYAELRHRIGFVPHDDILPIPLTMWRALNHAARLRFPQDVTAAERSQRIEEVLAELGLTAQAGQRLDKLSGGQRKRASIALELLTNPSLLFLDEPTAGLDPGYEKSVMQALRGLTDAGRSVIAITHTVAHVDICDRLLIIAPGGQLAYFGPPQHALAYFQCSDYADLFHLLERDSYTDWTARFHASAFHDDRANTPPAEIAPSRPTTAVPVHPVAQQGWVAQVATLCRRHAEVIAADRQYVTLLVILPLLLSLLAHAIPGHAGLSVAAGVAQRSSQPAQILTLLIVGGALMGCAASIREIAKERAIYLREYEIGLPLVAYLVAKLLVLTTLTGLQGLVLGLLGVVGLPPPDSSVLLGSGTAEVAVAVVAVTVASMILGLLISAFIGNAGRATPLLALVVPMQLILCGGLFAVHDRVVLEQLAWLSPSRWAYAMGASTVGLNALRPGSADPLWDQTSGRWLLALGMCATQAVVLVLILAVRLHRLGRHRHDHA